MKQFLFIVFFCILHFLSLQIFSQSQEEILRDLRNDNVPFKETQTYPKNFYLEKLKSIYLAMIAYLDNKEDLQAISEANKIDKFGITPEKIKIRGYAELDEDQILYLKIRRLRGEAYYNLRDFKNALGDSKYIVENHPRPVVFDFTRYAVSLHYSGEDTKSKRILAQAKERFKNENDEAILQKTTNLLFPNH